VATDDEDVRRQFLRRFGGCGCAYPVVWLDRTTPLGIQFALIDLLLLSCADFVGATPGSTFGPIAALGPLVRAADDRWPTADIEAGACRDRTVLDGLVASTLGALAA